jgi:hypothetical protein
MDFVLPPLPAGRGWRLELETADGSAPDGKTHPGGATLTLAARSIALLMERGTA